MFRALLSVWMVSIGAYCYSQAGNLCVWNAAYDTTSCWPPAGIPKLTLCSINCPVPVAGPGTYQYFSNENVRYGIGGTQLQKNGQVILDCTATCACGTSTIFFKKCDPATGTCSIDNLFTACKKGDNCLPVKVRAVSVYFKYCY